MNWKRSAAGLGIGLPVVALLAYGLTVDPDVIPSPLPGKEAPTFALAMLESGDTIRLEEHLGDVVVLNFWASWCYACRIEHFDLSEAARKYEGRGVQFYGILYNDSPQNGRAWIEMMGGQSYPALVDPTQRTAIDYGLYGAPETFVIGPDGRVAHKRVGPTTLAELSAIIDPLLEAVPAPPDGDAAGVPEDAAGLPIDPAAAQ
jgi:cytochrome c biogenesis protein CcmG/thiol:disulfide interchange protein DsbE